MAPGSDSSKIKEAVSAVDDFIAKYCYRYDREVEEKLDRIAELFKILEKYTDSVPWEDDYGPTDVIDYVEKLVMEFDSSNAFVEIDTPGARTAAETLKILQSTVQPLLDDRLPFRNRANWEGTRAYMWEESGRILFTINTDEATFCKYLDEAIRDLKNSVAVAKVMHS